MSFIDTRLARFVSCTMAMAIANMSVPYYAFARAEAPSKPSHTSNEKHSRLLGAKETGSMRGSTSENPFIAGSQKWDVSYKGVNLLTGNFSTSATDLTFEGGYGIPVNVTRSYSANNADEGPFGRGWTLSVDIRTTAGGLLKSSGAPNRSVPVNYHERPTEQGDPGIASANQPVEAVVATDASGDEETIQRDVDGILTNPAWDKNATVTEYELVVDPFNGTDPTKRYSIAKKITTTTPDGTVYVYEKKGSYPDGAIPYNQPTVDPEPTNVLKVTTVTDRHGNVTTYNYATGTGSSNQATFQKYNGTSVEQKLTSIEMPGDREIDFTWGTSSLSNRIVSAAAFTGSDSREVDYEFSTTDFHQITKATTPAGRYTTYDYSDASGATTGETSLLTSIGDQRGLVTTMHYVLAEIADIPFGSYTEDATSGVFCYKIVHPNLNVTRFTAYGVAWPTGEPTNFMQGSTPVPAQIAFADLPSDSSSSLSVASIQGTATCVFIGDSNPNLYKFKVQIDPYGVLGAPTAGGAIVERTYMLATQDLIQEIDRTTPNALGDLHSERNLNQHGSYIHSIHTDSTYNFLGNPLSKSITPYVGSTPGTSLTTEYAYWGATKYYQQKGTKDPAGRYSMSDYWDSDETDGRKGQIHYVYDSKFGSFTGTGSGWRSGLTPGGPNSANFDYDSYGRPTDVYKLKTTGSTPTYVHTLTSYGQLGGSATGGNASQVIEDEGSGKINRTTQTIEFDCAGRAVCVHDATGKYWVTTYDDDGQVTDVGYYTGGGSWGITQYRFGTSGIEKGVLISTLDQIGGISQTISYKTSGSGIGQVASIVEDNNSNYDYTVSYDYNDFGERAYATYETPTGSSTETVKWRYGDYRQVGDPTQGKRVFQTLNKQHYASSTWSDSDEEFHYQYDGGGRLREAAFAQTPRSGGYGADTADKRARALYEYDPLGKLWNLEYTWEVWNTMTTSYDSTKIYRNACDYDTGTQLKTESDNYWNNGSNSWSTSSTYGGRVDKYAYDSDLDYLTGATYNGSTPGTDWSYDPSGNRSNSGYTYDSLNRMTASPGSMSYENDILGNRTWRNRYSNVSTSARYTWDELGRMFSFCTPSSGAKYIYRADGMRVEKVEGLSLSWIVSDDKDDVDSSGYYDAIWASNHPTTRYFYDGQMAMGEDYTNGSTYTTTKYGIGARGIDYIEHYDGSSTIVGFPINDAHGNMIATLGRNSSPGFAIGDQKYFDAWGAKNSGSIGSTGIPKQRYGANLGHVQDDESGTYTSGVSNGDGLIYMRARYYEPGMGRFVSEDPGKQGCNWFHYCKNDPINFSDRTGKSFAEAASLFFTLGLLFTCISAGLFMDDNIAGSMAAARLAVICYSAALSGSLGANSNFNAYQSMGYPVVLGILYDRLLTTAILGARMGSYTAASVVVLLNFAYTLVLLGALAAIDMDSET